LTYSVTGPQSEPRLVGSILESYRRLSLALLEALRRLQVPAQSQADQLLHGERARGPVCFEVPSNYEITVEGKKLIGSAQARRRGGVLQHGSLPLVGDLSRIVQALVFPDETERQAAAGRLLARATTVEAVLGRAVTWDEAAHAFALAFEHCLNLELVSGELTIAERARADELVREKYAHPSWTERV
jgi:lipoate-protein ligase A